MTTIQDWRAIENIVASHRLIRSDMPGLPWECICGYRCGHKSKAAKREHADHVRSLIIQSGEKGERTNGK